MIENGLKLKLVTKKKRIFSANPKSKKNNFRYCISSADIVMRPSTNTYKVENENNCCGSPTLWLKKNKQSHTISFRSKFTNLCTKQTDLKNIDEVIVSSSNELQKSNNINTSKSKSKSGSSKGSQKNSLLLFKTMSKNVDFDRFVHTIFYINNNECKFGEILYENAQNTLYKCLNLSNGEIFVAKCCMNPKEKPKFETEIKILEKLNHQSVIKYISNSLIKNTFFIFMEFFPLGTIKNMIDTFGPLSEEIIKKYLNQIISGLIHIHSKGIIHCDLKCANLLLDTKSNAIIADFGSAKDIGEAGYGTGLIGSLPWCAPEIICGRRYDFRADVWSLGCVMVEMCSGKTPWDEKKIDNYYQCLNVIGKGDEIPKIPEDISESLKDLIVTCLNRDENKRPSLNEVKDHKFLL